MKIDLTKNGLDAVFTPWQQSVLTLLTSNKFDGWTSAQLHTGLGEILVEDNVSRASVIGFMKMLEAWGIVTVEKGYKRGGEYRIYSTKYSEHTLWEYIKALTMAWVRESDKTI